MNEEGDRLVVAIRDGLAAAADPKRAPGMQAYMKSAMPLAHFAARCVQLVPLAPISSARCVQVVPHVPICWVEPPSRRLARHFDTRSLQVLPLIEISQGSGPTRGIAKRCQAGLISTLAGLSSAWVRLKPAEKGGANGKPGSVAHPCA
jgi:hypothetical protein